MATITGAAAYQRLQPLQKSNIAPYVEEHVRYWKKKDDDALAAKKKQQAMEQQRKAKAKGDAFKLYQGLTPEENKGFLNDQIISTFEKNKGKYAQLAMNAANGDINARVKLEDLKRKYTGLVNANKIYGEKAAQLQEQKSKGQYNKYLDKPIEDFGIALSKGMYKLNDDLSLDMFDPTSGEAKNVDSSTLFNNEFLNSSFNKQPEFDKNGASIAKNILDQDDGQKIINDQTQLKGVRLVKNIFTQDPVEAISWYGQSLEEQGVDPKTAKPYDQLTELEKNQVAQSYYDQNVLPRIQQVMEDTTLEDAAKRAAIQSKRLDNQKKRRALKKEISNERTDLYVATDEQGEKIKAKIGTSEKEIDKSDLVFIGNQGISFNDVKGNKKTETTITNLYEDNGELVAIGSKVVKSPILDAYGDKTGRFKDKTVSVNIRDKNTLNRIARLIKKPDGSPHKNLSELSKSYKSTVGQKKQSNDQQTKAPLIFNSKSF